MSGVHDDLNWLTHRLVGDDDALIVLRRVEAEIARLDRIVSGHISRADRREGMVVAYDYDGSYVGCMGEQTWRWMVEHPEMDAAQLARCARLQQALEYVVARSIALGAFGLGHVADQAAEALAGPDTPTHRKQNVEYWRARSRVAEARCARLQRERDEVAEQGRVAAKRYGEEVERCARLQQALEAARREAGRAQDVRANRTRIIGNIALIADEALAGPDTPADRGAA